MLYVVATPIGNLEDISSRALRILSEVDVVLCEDTRVTRKLLSHYEIHTKTLSYHANSDDKKITEILNLLQAGKELALVTDAGTPGISDPGSRLVRKVRARFANSIPIVSIPGPSALTAALSLSGLPASDFLFLGFLPRKKGKKTLFEEIADSKRTVAFYESPHRVLKTLGELQKFISLSREVVIVRELSKIHEEVISGSVVEVASFLATQKEKQRGEFVVLLAPMKTTR